MPLSLPSVNFTPTAPKTFDQLEFRIRIPISKSSSQSRPLIFSHPSPSPHVRPPLVSLLTYLRPKNLDAGSWKRKSRPSANASQERSFRVGISNQPLATSPITLSSAFSKAYSHHVLFLSSTNGRPKPSSGSSLHFYVPAYLSSPCESLAHAPT